jgi:hypothetical protein
MCHRLYLCQTAMIKQFLFDADLDTHLNYSLLTNDNAPFYVACNENFTVKHYLLECHDFSHARNRFYCVNSSKELFNTIPSKNIIDYLKKINLYTRI